MYCKYFKRSALPLQSIVHSIDLRWKYCHLFFMLKELFWPYDKKRLITWVFWSFTWSTSSWNRPNINGVPKVCSSAGKALVLILTASYWNKVEISCVKSTYILVFEIAFSNYYMVSRGTSTVLLTVHFLASEVKQHHFPVWVIYMIHTKIPRVWMRNACP